MNKTEYLREWRRKNRDKVLNYKKKSYLKASKGFVVYTHICNGNLYVGMGNSKRPNVFSNRRDHHKEKFPKRETTVRILAKFQTREEARELEEFVIETIGLQNLINKYQ